MTYKPTNKKELVHLESMAKIFSQSADFIASRFFFTDRKPTESKDY